MAAPATGASPTACTRTARPGSSARREEEAELGTTRQPYCLVIGGGQGGIALGARLKRLGVPTIIVEKNARAGDSWRKRYKSLCLHDPVWYDHLPYLPFPDHWPVFSPKDKLGDWLEMYAKVMELNYWTSSECTSARYDEARKEWTVVVDRAGEQVTLRPKQLVLATGMSGVPEIPSFPGADRFRGEQYHSSQASLGRSAMRASAASSSARTTRRTTSAADLWEHGADVTMVQRSPTVVARSEIADGAGAGPLYSEDALAGHHHGIADLTVASIPHRARAARATCRVYEEIRRRDKDLYDRLDKVGFQYDFGEDGSGIHMQVRAPRLGLLHRRRRLRAGGRRQHQAEKPGSVERLTETSVVLTDGTELPADLDRLCHRLRLHERVGRPAHQPGGGRQGRQVLGARLGHRQGPRAPGRASCATCGSRRSRRRCGSTAATCSNRASTR